MSEANERHDAHRHESRAGTNDSKRSPWVAPAVETLPRLTELTLVSAGNPIDGSAGTGGGGSTVF